VKLAGYFFSKLIFSNRAGALVRRIAWLSVIGSSVSVTAFLLVLFVMNGMNQSIRQRILALEPHLSIQVRTMSSNLNLETLPIYQRLKESPEYKIAIFESQDVILRTLEGQFRGAQARGLTEASFKLFIQQLHQLERGKSSRVNLDAPLWEEDEIPGQGELVLGIDLAKTLNIYEGDFLTVIPPEGLILPLGETPKFERLKVRRIISTSLADMDSQYVFYLKGKALVSLRDSASRQVGYDVWLPNGEDARDVKDSLSSFSDVEIQTWMERNSALFYALKLEKMMIGIFLGLAGLIASFSILTVMALLISQKRRDLAMLRTLGLSSRRTVKIMTQVGVILGGTGALIGVVFGTGLSLWLEFYPIHGMLPEIYYDQQIPALVDWRLVVGVLLASFLIAVGGSYLPAQTVAELDPSDVLRQKN
jgi:lipoprotein-releasing system permease protein